MTNATPPSVDPSAVPALWRPTFDALCSAEVRCLLVGVERRGEHADVFNKPPLPTLRLAVLNTAENAQTLLRVLTLHSTTGRAALLRPHDLPTLNAMLRQPYSEAYTFWRRRGGRLQVFPLSIDGFRQARAKTNGMTIGLDRLREITDACSVPAQESETAGTAPSASAPPGAGVAP
jgi:hypothetical protein